MQLDVVPTSETLPLPLSLTLSTNDSSSPLAGSVRVRKAWCGRFAVFPSTAVSSTFSASVAPSVTAFESGDVALSLGESVSSLNRMFVSSLVLSSSAYTSAFAGDRNGGILKAPGRSRCN